MQCADRWSLAAGDGWDARPTRRAGGQEDWCAWGNGEFDIGIRTMAKPVPGLVEHLLVKSDFSPLLSPELAARVKSPEDLLKLPILDPLDEWFGQRFAEAGVEGYSSEGRSVSQMGLQSLLGRAAMAGILSGVSGKPTKFTQDQGIPGLDFGGDGLYAAA